MTQKNDQGTPVWVNAKGTTSFSYGGGGLTGIGAVYAMANPQTPDAQIMTTAQGLEGTNEAGGVTYYVDFVNNGPEPCLFNFNIGTF